MKKLLFALVGLLCTQWASAQKELLQLDEANQYVYYQVVDKPGTTADTLYNRARYFARSVEPKLKIETSDNNVITAKGKFLVYTGTSVVRKEGGEVNYTLYIETKENKYRYKISDMVFTPYKRDRFSNMAPQQGVNISLQKLTAILTQKEADNYLAQAGAFCKQTGDTLKKCMDRIVSAPKRQETNKKVMTDKW